MKKIFILIILIGFITNSYCQAHNIHSKRLFLTFNVSPDYCYRNMVKSRNDITDELWAESKHQTDSFHHARISYSCGFGMGYDFSPNVSITTDFLYSRRGYSTLAQLAYFAGDTSTATTRFKYNYFDLPIKLNYAINKNKLQIITSLGMTFNFHLGSRQYLKLSNPTIKFKSGNYSPNYVRKVINYSPTVGLGLGYSLTQNTKILFQPTFSYMMKSEWSDWNTYTANGSMQGRFETEHLWKFGISICLRHLVK